MKKIQLGFFGTPEYAVMTLEKLAQATKKINSEIAFVVTQRDKPQGRKMIVTAPPAKVWAMKHNIPVYQPEKLDDPNFIKELKKYSCDIFIVIAYGKIIPDEILNMPKFKSLNIHPSLLPKLRGPSPIETAILNDQKNTGVSIMKMDSQMDHGPIIAQKEVVIEPWPPTVKILGEKLVLTGADLLISIIADFIAGKIKEIEQKHNEASYTKKIKKEDGLIKLNENPYKNYLKIKAYDQWPSAFFFLDKDKKKIRVKITKASYKDGILTIEKVIPEGKNEINYKDL